VVKKRLFLAPRPSLFPTSVVVVTAKGTDDRVGATTIAWTGIMSSRPPVISVSFLPDSFTRERILESREFVVNIPDASLWKAVNFLGSMSGEWSTKLSALIEARHGLLTLTPSSRLRTPRIDECYANLECRCLSTIQVGLYDCFLGEVLAMHCNEDLYRDTDPRGSINHSGIHPLICLGEEYWAGGIKLGVSTENRDHPYARHVVPSGETP
jgi:flavin reductase (DIM6/NTAB) family NADH-FMN oxidoreductase RutF